VKVPNPLESNNVELVKSYEVCESSRRTVREAEIFRGKRRQEEANAAVPKGDGNGNNRADSAEWHDAKAC